MMLRCVDVGSEGRRKSLRISSLVSASLQDNSNYIVDLYFENEPIKDSYAAAKAIESICGVVEHGLFMDMVNVCIIAGANGVEVRERK